MNKKRISYAVLPFTIAAIILFISYFGNQWYAQTFGNPGVDYSYIFYNFNIHVPFLAWTIYPYVLAYPFWIGAFFYIAYQSKEAFYTLLTMLIVLFVICGLWYFFFQSDVLSWRLTSGLFLNNNYLTPRPDLNFTERLVLSIYDAAGPRNALPSLHTIMSWSAVIALRMIKKTPILPKVLIWILAISIIISTQTLKQHYIIDVIAGLILAESAYWIFRNSRVVKWVEDLFTRLNDSLRFRHDEPLESEK